MLITVVIPAAVALVGLWIWLAVAVERSPLDRRRLETFARRHGLGITAANGDRVIAYLATTRRWRATGLTAGIFASLAWSLPRHGVRVDFLTLFAGWFVGALVAEVRLAGVRFGALRAASLAPRAPAGYPPTGARAALPVAGLVSLAVAVATAITALRGHPVQAWPAALWYAAGAVTLVAVLATQWRVLRRAQPAAPADVLVADDAIRSRSLHVLAAGGTTLVLYCFLGQLTALSPALDRTAADLVVLARTAGYLLIPLAGWAMATAPWAVTRPGSRPTSPATP